MSDEYEPRHRRRMTAPDLPFAEFDFMAHDAAGQYVGRIYKTFHHPIRDKWKWNGSFPYAFRGRLPTPNGGFVDTPREAARKVEEYWDLCLQRLRG